MVKINTNKIFFGNRATIYKHQYTATQVRVTKLVKPTYIYMFSTHFLVMFQPQIQYYCVKQLWALQQGLFTKQTLHEVSGSRDSSGVMDRTCHGKVVGSSPSRSSRRIFFSRVNFLCWFSFWYLFHPLVTTVAYKRSKSFCQKCKWQVTTKHPWTLHMWLWMKWHCKLVQNCMVYRVCLLRWQQFHMAPAM